jgi:hypothetical protein
MDYGDLRLLTRLRDLMRHYAANAGRPAEAVYFSYVTVGSRIAIEVGRYLRRRRRPVPACTLTPGAEWEGPASAAPVLRPSETEGGGRRRRRWRREGRGEKDWDRGRVLVMDCTWALWLGPGLRYLLDRPSKPNLGG